MSATNLSGARSAANRLLRGVRDGWLILGMALALFLGLEWMYRAQGALRRALGGRSSVPTLDPAHHPYARQIWWPELRAEVQRGRVRFDPYRGWWPEPQAARYVHVDSAGRRVTIQPSPSAAGSRRLLLLGGSAMWGYTARDSFTIPSQVARRLAGAGAVEVVNLGQAAFTLTQEVTTLLLELRRGDVPDVVVFLDGNNEIATTFQSGSPGHVLNEAMFADRFRGTGGVWGDALGTFRRSQLVDRLARLVVRREAPSVPPSPAQACPVLARHYRNLSRSVAALGREYGFAVIFLWQPLRATTRKPLTEWEGSIQSWPGYRDMLQRCTTAVDSAMRDRFEVTYVPLHQLFDRDTASVFLDEYGHVTESANGVIADRIVELVRPLLASRGRRVPR